MREYKISVTWVLVIAVGTVVRASSLTAVTTLGEQINALAVTIAGDVVCSQCAGTNGDGTNDIKDGSVTNSKIASSAVTKSKLASNSVHGGKITDGTVSAADLRPDSVGASEIKGVTKLIFAECSITDNTARPLGGFWNYPCDTGGATIDDGDRVLATNNGNLCYSAEVVVSNAVVVHLTNICP
jgi:hypothetical protein